MPLAGTWDGTKCMEPNGLSGSPQIQCCASSASQVDVLEMESDISLLLIYNEHIKPCFPKLGGIKLRRQFFCSQLQVSSLQL